MEIMQCCATSRRFFYEAKRTDTFYTVRVQSGQIATAKIVSLHYHDGSRSAKYYVWCASGDTVDYIARIWFQILWGPGKDDPRDFAPMFHHESTRLQWEMNST